MQQAPFTIWHWLAVLAVLAILAVVRAGPWPWIAVWLARRSPRKTWVARHRRRNDQ
jgi:hypothetical protein